MVNRNETRIYRIKENKSEEERQQRVLIWYSLKQVWLSKEYVIKHLIKENSKAYYRHGYYLHANNRMYLGAYDCILKEMDNINTIQIYEDDVIRLHLNHEHHEQPKSIIFIAQEEEVEVLKDLAK